MPAPRTGAISFDDIHVEAGGTSGTTCSMENLDIRQMLNRQHLQNSTQSLEDYRGAALEFYIEDDDRIIDLPNTVFNGGYAVSYNGTNPVAVVYIIDLTYNLNTIDYSVSLIAERNASNVGTINTFGTLTALHNTTTPGVNNTYGNISSLGSIGGGSGILASGTIRYGGVNEIQVSIPHWVIQNADLDMGTEGVQELHTAYMTSYTQGTNAINVSTPNLHHRIADAGDEDTDFDLNELNYVKGGINGIDMTPPVFYGPLPNNHSAAPTQRYKLLVLSDGDGPGNTTADQTASLDLSGSGETVELRVEFRPFSGTSMGATTLKIRTPQSGSRGISASSSET